MRIPTGRRVWGMAINMTPMIDIVFLLIVYFVATSHLARLEQAHAIELPKATKAQPEAETRRSRLRVNVLKDGTVFVGSRRVEAQAVAEVLKAELEGRPQSEMEIRIRADRAVPYRFVEPILLSCARAGIWQIGFAVLPETEGDRSGANERR